MKQINLYINNQRIDLFKDESIVFNQSIQDLKELGKVFTDYTKTFTIPASANNNKILKHIYNYDIIDTYDPRKKLPAIIELNYEDFKTGKIKVEGVILKLNKPYAYKVTFYGDTVKLNDILGDDKLNTLDFFEDFAFSWNQSSFVNSSSIGLDFTVNSVTYTDAIITPLISVKDRIVYDSSDSSGAVAGNIYHSGNQSGTGVIQWENFKPAIRLYTIIKAIESTYSEISFSEDFFNTYNLEFYNLYLWLHNQKGTITSNTDLLTRHKIRGFSISSGATTSNFLNNLLLGINGTLTITSIDFTSFSSVELQIEIIPTSNSTTFTLQIDRDGTVIEEIPSTGTLTTTKTITEAGRYNFYIVASTNTAFSASSLNVLRKSNTQQQRATGYSINAFTTETNQTFRPHHHMPDMKIIDLLRGIMQMFNLVAYVDSQTNKIIVQTSDSYFNNSVTTHEITDFVDVNNTTVDVALPYSSVELKYEGNDTFLTKNHEQTFNKTWGSENFAASDKLHGSPFTLELPFEHHKYEKLLDANGSAATTIQWGWSVDENENTILGKPLLFYPIQINSFVNNAFVSDITQAQYRYTNISGSQAVAFFPSYYIPSNSLSIDSAVSKSNIHFKYELNEYSGAGFTDTLFEKYHKTYLSALFNFKRRLTKLKSYLPVSTLLKLSLADKFLILNRLYRINTISTNLATGVSDMELINLNEPLADQRAYEPIYANTASSFGTIDSTVITIDLTTPTIDII